MLVIENVANNGTGLKAGGVWYNVDRGVQIPPVGTTITGQIVQGMYNGKPNQKIVNLAVVGGQPAQPQQQQYGQQPVQQPQYAQPAQQQGYAKPAYKAAKPAYNNDRWAHDTTADQKLRYNALTLATSMVKDGNLDVVLAIGADLYNVIKDGFTAQAIPVQQLAVQQNMQQQRQPAQYSAFQQPEFGEDDVPFAN